MRNNLNNNPQDPLYRRVQFLWALLWVMFITFSLMGFINHFLIAESAIAVLHFSIGLISLALIVWHARRPQDTILISWLVAGVNAAVLIIYVVAAQGQHYALYWLAIYPPITFFLLGRKWGYLTSILVIGSCLIYVSQVSPQWQPAPFTARSLANIVIATAALLIILRHIEKTRSEAFQYLEEHGERLEYIASTDPLTGLVNRSKLDKALSQGLRKARQERQDFSVILLDIDHFKRINDTYGHQTGDSILVELAQLLRSNTRGSDTLGRWGGEEFLLVAEACSRQQSKVLAEKIRHAIEAYSFHDNIHITASFGIASFQPGDDETTLVRRVDKALYAAKGQGRNRTVTDADINAE
ncbi:GGDEF domain-containing protein [Pseudidiomarina insulisalsae]|uniref:diguanylate cyclase n=1 Tax=Pseudidiomarina insulisalsae TaxID=575789 RepID=A0A432YPF3_9GAMM|nr:GGDEF domain-containing protein [Pseudidiomarina insulisalsae]RUO62998.1 hypothetical protein CWI71_01870 [Pseudidiomarina insulisalsae]